eukprot:gene27359-45678_t
MPKTLYDVLQVPLLASDDDIKKAYKKEALKWHPDRHPDENAKLIAEEKFKAAAKAFAVLSDPRKRLIYNQ